MWLTRLALKNPILILMVSLGITVLGLVSVSRLPVDIFPNIAIPTLRVVTFYPGASPRDIERTITYPVEKAVSAISDIDHVESTSKQGFSSVGIFFNWGANLDSAQVEVIQRLQQIAAQLPTGITPPFVFKIDLSNIPVCLVTVSGGGLDERRLYDLAYNTVEPQLEHLPRVASADINGGKIRQINVEVDREALKQRGLGVADVVRAVQAANLLLPSGNLRAGARDYNLFTNTQISVPARIGDLVLRSDASGVVHVHDVARVVDGSQEQTNVVRLFVKNDEGQLAGGRGVFMRVLKQPGANTVDVVDAIKKALPNVRGLPAGVKLDLYFDQSRYIRKSMTSLREEALTGSLLAIAVILLFLRSARSTLIIAIAIPLSIVGTFIPLYFLGQTLNVFTLGGLALGVGRLVDDSIVELENIQRHLNMGKTPMRAALDAAQEVAMPILVSTITTIVVFAPVLFLQGIPRLLFSPLALTIAISLGMSFFVSRTVTPILCVMILRPEAEHSTETAWGRTLGFTKRFFDGIDHGYQRVIEWALHRKAVIAIATFGAFAASIAFVLPRIGKDFFPDTDESQFTANVKLPVGTRMERTEEAVKRLEHDLIEAVGVENIQSVVGTAGQPGGRSALFSRNSGPHAGSVQINLVEPALRGKTDVQLMEQARKKVYGEQRYPGATLFFSSGGIMKFLLNANSAAPIDVEVQGYDLADARDYSRAIAGELRTVPGLEDVLVSREENYPELDVVVDREKAGALGFSENEIANTVLTSLSGNTNTPSIFSDPVTGNQYNIIVRLADRYRADVNDLGDVYLPSRVTGKPVALSTIAEVRRSAGPVQIDRKYQQRTIDITGNNIGRDLASVSADAEERIARITPPPGFSARLTGQTQSQREAFASLLVALLLALMLVYMVMASQFRSLADPLIIMVSVPMGLIGVFLALWLTHTSLSVNAYMGIIMMVGIVVSNGVLLVDYARVLRAAGVPLEDAVVRAGRTRLRPILMTTLATVLGLLPMALGLGEGSESNIPLARAVIGGLVVSTALTLLLVPTLYVAFEKFLGRFRKEKPAAEELAD
jgi:hydrophobe/amphiphile efflux-1 (HAE1) family protein